MQKKVSLESFDQNIYYHAASGNLTSAYNIHVKLGEQTFKLSSIDKESIYSYLQNFSLLGFAISGELG